LNLSFSNTKYNTKGENNGFKFCFRAAAARLTKGYSVVSNKVYADKENVKEMGKVSLKPNGGKENIMRDSGKSGLSNYGKENSKLIGTLRTSIAAPKWNKFQLPVKPAKSKKIDPALKKSESVVSLPSISEVSISIILIINNIISYIHWYELLPESDSA